MCSVALRAPKATWLPVMPPRNAQISVVTCLCTPFIFALCPAKRLNVQHLSRAPSAQPFAVSARAAPRGHWASGQDRKSVGSGTSVSVRVDLGGCRIIKKKKEKKQQSK